MTYWNASVVASQSFFTPQLQSAVSLVRGQPNDEYPFSVALTFVAPEEMYKGGLEIYVPQRTFLYDPGARERYNPFTRQFYKVVTADLPVRPTGGQGTTVTLYPVTMEKGEALTVHLPLKAFSEASGVSWPAPQVLAYPEAATQQYSVKLSNLQRKATAEITRLPSPVYTPGMVAAVVGPQLQSTSKSRSSTLVTFRLLFGDKIPSGRLEIGVMPLINASATNAGTGAPSSTGTCTGWFQSSEEVVHELDCPLDEGVFLFKLLPSTLVTHYNAGWVALGFELEQSVMAVASFFRLTVRDSAGTLIYSADHPTPSTFSNPCIQRFSHRLISPQKTGYSARLLLVMQTVNCDNPAQPLGALAQQVEPLSFSLPSINGLDEIDYISSVTVQRQAAVVCAGLQVTLPNS
ncbi:hypothetical protein cyc_02699 [Cyclospora cayetanensis]|uniref:Uncharacterized protein n=1 Tax=Cyclospora cayetanensis TaxID=88456 RepID=A0A1D3CY56_9EIME|nr:hypothetical protein cyc_02699 [Cyclospora cayetanensis]